MQKMWLTDFARACLSFLGLNLWYLFLLCSVFSGLSPPLIFRGCVTKLIYFVKIGWEVTNWSYDLADFYVKIFNINNSFMDMLETVWKIQKWGVGKQSLSLNINTLQSSEKIIQVLMTSIQSIFFLRTNDLLQSKVYTQIFLASSKCPFLGIVIQNIILMAKLK